MAFCCNCGKKLCMNAKFCDNCAAPVSADTAKVVAAAKAIPEVPKKAIFKKALLFGAIGIAAVAVIVLIIALITGGKNRQDNHLLYVKDNEIFYRDLSKDTSAVALTSQLLDSDKITAENLSVSGYALGMMTYIRRDGKLLFFPDKMNDEGTFNLYYRDTTGKDAVTVKIDTDVVSYKADKSAEVVTYRKGTALYRYILKTAARDKIADDIVDFDVSANGNKIVYLNAEGIVYRQYMDNGEKEKIVSGAEKIIHLTKDFKTVYYLKENALYKQTEGTDPVKIASDVEKVLQVYDSGEIFFVKSSAEDIVLTDYIEDDMKDTDTNLTKPEKPASPYLQDYSSYDEFKKAYDAYREIYEAYLNAYEIYTAKILRDSMRQALEDRTVPTVTYSLYYFDGKENTVLSRQFNDNASSYAFASDAAVMIYSEHGISSLEKIKLSQISDTDALQTQIQQALRSENSGNKYVAIKGITTQINQDNAAAFRINSKGTCIYYVDEIPENGSHGDLYKIDINGEAMGVPKLYDSNVYASSLDYFGETDTLLYLTDWNTEKQYGTLKFFDGEKTARVADDVRTADMLSDGRILYLYDYSIQYCTGELRIWDESKTEKVDDDVVCIIPIHQSNTEVY